MTIKRNTIKQRLTKKTPEIREKSFLEASMRITSFRFEKLNRIKAGTCFCHSEQLKERKLFLSSITDVILTNLIDLNCIK